jgi:hypothetical protein
MKGKLFSGYEDFFCRMELQKLSFYPMEAAIFNDFFAKTAVNAIYLF